ncbi:DUF3363 domain-containing protein [Sphingobium sp. CR2-8]|uniref:DUF3363 domain-containing protein n=1 Tax=Sphingobium sp. CR2-8 TaxID=1306534 RepID=UPI003FA38A43
MPQLPKPQYDTARLRLTTGRRGYIVDDKPYALIERAYDFSLIPWRTLIEPAICKNVYGIGRSEDISWTSVGPVAVRRQLTVAVPACTRQALSTSSRRRDHQGRKDRPYDDVQDPKPVRWSLKDA